MLDFPIPGFGNFSEHNWLGWREPFSDVDLRLIIVRFLASFELRAVDRSVFHHLSPGPAPPFQSLQDSLRRHRSPRRHPARGCVPPFCVLRDEHLAFRRPVRFASPATAAIVCYTPPIHMFSRIS